MLLSFLGSYGQKNYTFDYVMEYQIEHTAEDGKKTVNSHYEFISSTNSGYLLYVFESKDMVVMRLWLDGGKYYMGSIEKEGFLVEAISLKCPATGTDKGDGKLKDYKVIPKNDTIINTRRYSQVVLQPVNERKFRKGELYKWHYIIDNSLHLQFPALPAYDLAHRFWKEQEDNIPNGFLKELTLTDIDGKTVYYVHLVQFIKLDKFIIIDKSCK